MYTQHVTIPATIRSRIVLEVASELVGRPDWTDKQVRVTMRPQGGENWSMAFFGSDSPAAIDEIASGRSQVAIINPGFILTMAVRGSEPFKEPLPLRAIAIIPSYDQLVFAVTEATGLTSLDDIRERRYPLKVSLRRQRDHSVLFAINSVLSAAGFSLDDIVSWGGEVRHDRNIPWPGTPTWAAVERGETNAIFDEAVQDWGSTALDAGLRFLPLGETLLGKLEQMGFRSSPVTKAEFPALLEDMPAIDFSGWIIFTRADTPDEVITAFCSALEARKDRLSWEGPGRLPLENMTKDTPETPIDVPFHPAAERFWRELGYMG